MNMIPAGYQLHVKTWENDGDSYKTSVNSGLTVTDVHFLLCIARRFKSVNNPGSPGLGNGWPGLSALQGVILDAFTKYPDVSNGLREVWQEALEVEAGDDESSIAYELITDYLIGSPDSEHYDGYFCRVFDTFSVYLYDTPVPDVTSEFK